MCISALVRLSHRDPCTHDTHPGTCLRILLMRVCTWAWGSAAGSVLTISPELVVCLSFSICEIEIIMVQSSEGGLDED